MPEIPHQFKNYPKFRYLLLGRKAKKPIEKGWKVTKNYSINSYVLNEHLKKGNNYGVITGFGDLVVGDADHPSLAEVFREKLPKSLEVTSGREKCPGTHFYFTCKDLTKSIRLVDKDLSPDEPGYHIGEIQSHKKFVVGPGSIHPSGNVYHISSDLPIVEVTEKQLRTALVDYIKVKEPMQYIKSTNNVSKIEEKINLKITDIVDTSKFTKLCNGDVQGSHPVHGDSDGSNFCINTHKNCWFCFRHDTGGGPLLLLAVLNGLLSCEDASNKLLNGEILDKTLIIADKYLDPAQET